MNDLAVIEKISKLLMEPLEEVDKYEWDLFEYFGYRKDRGYDQMGMHLCYEPYPNQQWEEYFMGGYDKMFDCEDWHTYGFLWTSEYAAWYIDGKEVRRLSAEGITAWPSKEMYIVLNNGTRTSSPDQQTQWPNFLKVDYIKLFTHKGAEHESSQN